MLDTLPVELVELLFGYLCLSDQLQLNQVCKSLYRVFWQSNIRQKFQFRIDRMQNVKDLVGSRIFQMSVINDLVLLLDHIADPDMEEFLSLWDQLAPQLTSLTVYHRQPQDVFRLLKSTTGLVSLNWMYSPDEDTKVLDQVPDQDLKTSLANLKDLEMNFEMAKPAFSKFFDDLMCAAVPPLTTLNLKASLYVEVLMKHVAVHAATLRNLSMPDLDMNEEQLVSLGAIPKLRLLQLNMSNFRNISQKGFIRFLQLQPHLRTLDVSDCDEVIFDVRTWESVRKEFASSLSHLTSLTGSGSSNPKFSHYIPELKQLKELRVWESFPQEALADSLNKSGCQLLTLHISHVEVLRMHQDLLANLRNLTLSSCLDESAFPDVGQLFAQIWQHCRNLERLVIFDVIYNADSGVALSCNNLNKLTSVYLSVLMQNGWTESAAKLLQLPNLRRLTIKFSMQPFSQEFVDDFTSHLASITPRLESLTFDNAYVPGDVDEIDAMKNAKLWPRIKRISID